MLQNVNSQNSIKIIVRKVHFFLAIANHGSGLWMKLVYVLNQLTAMFQGRIFLFLKVLIFDMSAVSRTNIQCFTVVSKGSSRVFVTKMIDKTISTLHPCLG